jgi:hypothetical protein
MYLERTRIIEPLAAHLRDRHNQDPHPKMLDCWTTGDGNFRYLAASGQPDPFNDRRADVNYLRGRGHSIRLHEYAIGQAGDHDTWRI